MTREDIIELETVSKLYATKLLPEVIKHAPDSADFKTSISDGEVFIAMMAILFANQCFALTAASFNNPRMANVKLSDVNDNALKFFTKIVKLEFEVYQRQFGEKPNMKTIVEQLFSNFGKEEAINTDSAEYKDTISKLNEVLKK